MTLTLQYRGYDGSIQFSQEDDLLHGRLLGIRDLVSYEGVSLHVLEKSFQEAVDDYLLFCNKMGKEPNISSNESVASALRELKGDESPFPVEMGTRMIEEVLVGKETIDGSEVLRDVVQPTENDYDHQIPALPHLSHPRFPR